MMDEWINYCLFIFIYDIFKDIVSTSDEVCTDFKCWNAREKGGSQVSSEV